MGGEHMEYRKKALVTGASRGIGAAIALTLAEHGYDVGINYYESPEEAEAIRAQAEAKGAKAVCFKADVGVLSEVHAMFDAFLEEFGKIDLLVNNAGISWYKPFLEVDEEFWTRITNVNWRGPYFCAQRAAQDMVAKGTKGQIINISSNHTFGCWPNATVYGSNKAALTKFTKNAAMELAPHGIRVNAIAPGYTDVGWDPAHPVYLAKTRIPMKRFAEPREIAQAVLFLESEYSTYITGECIKIDGGALLPVVPENDLM